MVVHGAQDNETKRLVIFAGPHKSASSTVQEFFCQYATGRPKYRKMSAFQNWRWPVVTSSRIPPRKQLSRLVYTHVNNDTMKDLIYQTLAETFQKAPNMVLGSEEFDRFGKTPWSHRNGVQAIQKLIQHLKQQQRFQVEIVVNYRTPRQTQWVSIWKQLTTLDVNIRGEPDRSYPEWVCHDENEKVWEYLDSVANPLGLVQALLRVQDDTSFHVTLLDMGGISNKGLDIAHVSACAILQVPCKEGWVKGIDRILQQNRKQKPLENVTLEQVEQIERWFRLRDCAYEKELQATASQQKLTVLYQDTLWQSCSSFDANLAQQLLNTTFFLELLQSQFDCGDTGKSILSGRDGVVVAAATTKGTFSTPTGRDSHPQGLSNQFVSRVATDPNWLVVQILQWAVILVLFGALFHFRKSRSRRRS